MPLIRRLAKRGFANIFRREPAVVNVGTLNRFAAGTVVTPELLKEKGIVKSLKNGIKILGQGELEKELTVRANSFSRQAEEKISSAGGKAEVI